MVASYLVILWMSFAVSPGYVLKYPLLTALAHVSCTGTNSAVCNYLMEFYLKLTWCKWLLWFVGLSRLWRGALHKPVITTLVTFNSTYSSLVTATLWWLKLASKTASHNLQMDMREIYANPGRMCDFLASSGKVANASQQPLVECSIWPFGCFTWIGATGRNESSWGTYTFR